MFQLVCKAWYDPQKYERHQFIIETTVTEKPFKEELTHMHYLIDLYCFDEITIADDDRDTHFAIAIFSF